MDFSAPRRDGWLACCERCGCILKLVLKAGRIFAVCVFGHEDQRAELRIIVRNPGR